MPDEPKLNTSSKQGRSGLGRAERALAGFVGLGGVGVGGVGVFLSDNQAGTTAILLLGAAFLLMAIQGTAVIKVGKESFELERRDAALELSERAAIEVEQKNLPAAASLQEAAKELEPSIRREPSVQQVDGQIFELEAFNVVSAAVADLALDIELRTSIRPSLVTTLNPDDHPADIVVRDTENAARKVAILVKKNDVRVLDTSTDRLVRSIDEPLILITPSILSKHLIDIVTSRREGRPTRFYGLNSPRKVLQTELARSLGLPD